MKATDKYVTPEQAMRLKSLGFNEPVVMQYVSLDPDTLPVPCLVTPVDFNALEEEWKSAGFNGIPVPSLFKRVNDDHQGNVYACPTLQEACEWFQDQFGYENNVSYIRFSKKYSWDVYFKGNDSAGGMGIVSKRDAYLRLLTVMLDYHEKGDSTF